MELAEAWKEFLPQVSWQTWNHSDVYPFPDHSSNPLRSNKFTSFADICISLCYLKMQNFIAVTFCSRKTAAVIKCCMAPWLFSHPKDISVCLLHTAPGSTALRSLSSNYFFISGLILILPCTDTFIKVDLRTVTCNIPPQEVTIFQQPFRSETKQSWFMARSKMVWVLCSLAAVSYPIEFSLFALSPDFHRPYETPAYENLQMHHYRPSKLPLLMC